MLSLHSDQISFYHVRLAGKFQRRDLLRLRALCPQIYHNGILIILNSSYLTNSQQSRDILPRCNFCLPESRKSHRRMYCLHLEAEGNPCNQKQAVQAEKPVYTNHVKSLIYYPVYKFCLDPLLVEYLKLKFICPVDCSQIVLLSTK